MIYQKSTKVFSFESFIVYSIATEKLLFDIFLVFYYCDVYPLI